MFLALRDPDVVLVHDETILSRDRQVGRMTSGNYGYTIGRACGIGVIDADASDDAGLLVDCGGVLVAADVSSQPFYDTTNERLRG